MKDGGPAFPGSYTGPQGAPRWADGMSLRDWFAGMAKAGGCVADQCYAEADIMLAQREKTE